MKTSDLSWSLVGAVMASLILAIFGYGLVLFGAWFLIKALS